VHVLNSNHPYIHSETVHIICIVHVRQVVAPISVDAYDESEFVSPPSSPTPQSAQDEVLPGEPQENDSNLAAAGELLVREVEESGFTGVPSDELDSDEFE